MIKKILTIALLLPLLLWAKSPEEEDVLYAITDSRGEYYYPSLMERFDRGDLSLTLDHYHYLYYGYLYQEEYKPLLPISGLENLLVLASKIDVEKPNEETLREIIDISGEILKQDPFNPKVWNILAYAYGVLEDEERVQSAYDRVEKILRTIDRSGDGVKKDTPKHILMFDHALDLMASKGLNTSKPMIVSRDVEFVPLLSPHKVDGKKFRGYYFDFSRVYINKPDSVTYTRDRTWQFNNLKPREYK